MVLNKVKQRLKCHDAETAFVHDVFVPLHPPTRATISVTDPLRVIPRTLFSEDRPDQRAQPEHPERPDRLVPKELQEPLGVKFTLAH